MSQLPFEEPSQDNARKRKHHVTMCDKKAYISNKLERQSHSLRFLLKNKHQFHLPAFFLNHALLTTLLLPWTNSVVPTLWTLENAVTDLIYCLGPKNESSYLDIKPKVFKKNDNFRFVLIFPMGEAVFKLSVCLRIQLVIAAKNFGRRKLVPSADTNNVQRPR